MTQATHEIGTAQVHLQSVTLERGGRAVLRDLDLVLNEPRIGVVGANGAGKSQLARLISGLERPSSGDVRICGCDVARDRRAALRLVGVIFQNPEHQIIFPTVGEEMTFGLHALGQSRDQAADSARAALARFGCVGWYDRPVDLLSQGQRHLLCLMAVLAMSPRVIVLDEPFNGIDLAVKLRLNRYLAGLEHQLIHISHDLEAIADYDRILWIDGGRLKQDGPPDSVLPAYRAAMIERAADDAVAVL